MHVTFNGYYGMRARQTGEAPGHRCHRQKVEALHVGDMVSWDAVFPHGFQVLSRVDNPVE